VGNYTDIGNQFEWLDATLAAADAAGERVFLLGHIEREKFLIPSHHLAGMGTAGIVPDSVLSYMCPRPWAI
jgi:hypothetical protein